ncbi:hypothetical protein DL240_05185 [Lujinxingia litoralis]|uniref:DUF72 domain-containing protein n=1 Tax=Lujinxingia litoralis TaxID=2211119 RepID=A0A328C6J0_9DELT|nr:DUF72 domain-containing protein [Lujinxingia litoralis]RAL23555.1 hypothetical protein DL240_05185 [Lujinxingia litoralis]
MVQEQGRVLIGTSGWAYDDWDGVFYPGDISGTERLTHYATRFNTVEIDSTFYAIPARGTVQGWYQRTPDDFVFSAKFPRSVTHEARLVHASDDAMRFVETMSELAEKLGALVLQLPPAMKVDAIDDLERFFEGLPDGYAYAVEVRDRSWLRDEFADLLKRWRVALVLTDGQYLERFWRVTSQICYIRWLGRWRAFEHFDRVQADRSEELAWWVPRIRHFVEHGGTVLGYVNNNYTGHSPATAEELVHMLEPASRR